jgi:hypothetical protein
VPDPFDALPVTTTSAKEAFEQVLATAGASLPVRDTVDTRIIRDVRERTGKVIDSQKEVGGWPVLKSLPPQADSDHDGIPDDWETKHGLNPREAADAKTVGKSGYTNLEEYLNGTDPRQFVDYRERKNNVNTLHQPTATKR